MSGTPTLGDIERLCWRLSGWRVEQRDVDTLLAAVKAYAGGQASEGASPLAPGGGTGEAETAAESPEAPVAVPNTPDDAPGPQTGVRHLHITGTLTLVCPPASGAVQPAPEQDEDDADTAWEHALAALAPEVSMPEPEPVHEYAPEPVRGATAARAAAPMRTGGDGPKRTCRKCGGTFALEEFFRDHSRGVDGRKNVCRACENLRKRDARRARTARKRVKQEAARARTTGKAM